MHASRRGEQASENEQGGVEFQFADHPARARIEASLRMEGYANYGGDWQCPACRCRVASDHGAPHADLSLRLELDGEAVRLHCSYGCRENTIRAMLGMAAYVDDSGKSNGARPRGDGRHH